MRSNSIRTTVLAATALLAALSLTACGGANDGTSESSKAGSAAPVANIVGKQAQPPTAAPENDATATDAGTQNGASGRTKNTAKPVTNSGKGVTGSTGRASKNSSLEPVTCTGDNTTTTVSKVSRPINHLLLTVTNTGDRPCYAYYAPKLRFDDAQSVFPILDDSQPQAVVTLDQGQSAYAAIGLSGEDDQQNLHQANHLQVNFSGRNPEGSTGTPAELPLPADTYWGDNGFVTYWQTEMADALAY